MSYYIGTLEDVTAYNERVGEGMGLGKEGMTTILYDTPRKHPTKELWVIEKHNSFEDDSMIQVEVLDAGWEEIYKLDYENYFK